MLRIVSQLVPVAKRIGNALHQKQKNRLKGVRISRNVSLFFSKNRLIYIPNQGGSLHRNIHTIYARITTDANPMLAEIHNTKKQQPVILTEDIEFSWLDKGLTKSDIESYCVPLGEEHYDAYPIKPFNMTDENSVFERLTSVV